MQRHHFPDLVVDEARAIAEEAEAKNLDSTYMHFHLASLDFLQNDRAGVQRELAVLNSRPEGKALAVSAERRMAYYDGKVAAGRKLLQSQVETLESTGSKFAASYYVNETAIKESLVGNVDWARKTALQTITWPLDADKKAYLALALALSGDTDRPTQMLDEMAKAWPEGTWVRFVYGPEIRAAIALQKKDPITAIEELRVSPAFDLVDLKIPYLRGQAYLAAQQGPAAATEFQKIFDHRGTAQTDAQIDVVIPLAQLGLARAYAMSCQPDKAKIAYQDFFATWKDADPDVPVLKQAKAEYAKLQ